MALFISHNEIITLTDTEPQNFPFTVQRTADTLLTL